MEEVQENIKTMTDAAPNSLTETELELINPVQRFTMKELGKCTDCRYCLPCPQGVEIPRVFSILNHASVYNVMDEENGSTKLCSM